MASNGEVKYMLRVFRAMDFVNGRPAWGEIQGRLMSVRWDRSAPNVPNEDILEAIESENIGMALQLLKLRLGEVYG